MDFDLASLGPMLGMFQQRMEQFKEQSAALRCEGTAGGGLVRIVVSGDNVVQSLTISPEAYDDRELLEDLIRAATNEALRKVKEAMAQNVKGLAGGLPIPPGILPF